MRHELERPMKIRLKIRNSSGARVFAVHVPIPCELSDRVAPCHLDGVVESSCITLGFSVGLDVVDDLLGMEVGVRLENFQLAWMSLALYLGWKWTLP